MLAVSSSESRLEAERQVIGPAEIDEMMAEYADAIAGAEPAATDPVPVWQARDVSAATTAPPSRTVGIVRTSFLFPFGMCLPAG